MTHRTHTGIVAVAIAALVLALLTPLTLARAGDDPATLRTFDDDPLGPAARCSAAAADKQNVHVAPAAFDGASETNQALLVLEEDRDSQVTAHCEAAFSSISHIQFDWARGIPDPADALEGFTFGIRGLDQSGAEVDAWWFMIAPTGDDANLRIYDGQWRVLTVLEGWGEANRWHTIQLTATPTEVNLWADGMRLRADTPRTESVSLGSTVFSSSGPLSDSSEFYIDNLINAQNQPDDWPTSDALGFVSTGQVTGIVDEPLDSVELARFVAPTSDPDELEASIDWGDGTAPAEATITAEGEEFVVRGSHTFELADRFPVQVSVTDGNDEISVRLQIIVNRPFDVLATETDPHNIRFPHGIRLDSGRLLVTYYAGATHQDLNGHQRVIRSDDGGQTWSAPQVVADGPHDDRDGRLTQLSDGTVVMVYFVTEDPAQGSAGAWIVRSTDDGDTWSEPVPITAESTALHAPVVELANGDLLVPLYGTDPADTSRHRSTVVRSTDGGLTWTDETVIPGPAAVSFPEPFVSVLPDGSLVALLRSRGAVPQVAYLSRSFDNGHTWTMAQPTTIPAESHDVVITSEGMALVTYGDVGPGAQDRPLSAILIADPYGDWSQQATNPLRLWDAGNGDQGNPASIELGDGSFWTLGFQTASRSLIGIRTELDDYLSPADPTLSGSADLELEVVRRAQPEGDLAPVVVGWVDGLQFAGKHATATVDFGDGRGPVQAQLTARGDGRIIVTAIPYYVRTGTYRVTVVVHDREQVLTAELEAQVGR